MNKFGSAAISPRPVKLGTPVLISSIIILHFAIQIVLPFRYLFYPGELFWTEEGFRFSWRVMLIEKAGTAFFYVKDAATGREAEISNAQYLTPNQEKMMSTQPDMMLQFAHFIANEFKTKGVENPEVRVESYVTLNGSGSRPFTNPNIDLSKLQDGFSAKNWILPFNSKME